MIFAVPGAQEEWCDTDRPISLPGVCTLHAFFHSTPFLNLAFAHQKVAIFQISPKLSHDQHTAAYHVAVHPVAIYCHLRCMVFLYMLPICMLPPDIWQAPEPLQMLHMQIRAKRMAPIVGEEKTVHDGKYVGEMKNGKREGHGRTTYSWGVRIGTMSRTLVVQNILFVQANPSRIFKNSVCISSTLPFTSVS